mmetsp:Transcript_32488/g.92595  ORF Transcript_32488/g.92595 Transcript_32488/m.92595 type:complete len:116 (+) Transcript_32488:97-444(+)
MQSPTGRESPFEYDEKTTARLKVFGYPVDFFRNHPSVSFSSCISMVIESEYPQYFCQTKGRINDGKERHPSIWSHRKPILFSEVNFCRRRRRRNDVHIGRRNFITIGPYFHYSGR